MAKTELVFIALIAVAAIGLFNLKSNMEPHENIMFEIWKEKHNKNYDAVEHNYRFQIWLKNFEFVRAQNAKYDAGVETYYLEMNLFADLTNEEFVAKYHGFVGSPQVTSKCTGKQAPTENLPASVNWEDKGAVTPVKNQGQCGSCWAFSTTGSLEGAHFIATQKLDSYSEQQLVDCSGSYKNQGCNGGLMDQAFWYVKDNGITLESTYPYRGVGGACKYQTTDKAWTISDCTDVTPLKEQALMAAIAQQPVSVAIQANHLSFQLYKGGVYSGDCGTRLDHGVLAVGYGDENGKKYYRVKNSWGAGWGVKGYILIERNGDGKGKCGIQEVSSFPIA
jgi:cathepsin L